MSVKNVELFIERAKESKDIREKLMLKGESYKGDNTDLESVIRHNIVPVAEETGLDFTADEYMAYLKAQSHGRELSGNGLREQSNAWELSEDDLNHVVGGVGDVDVSKSNTGGDVTIIDNHREENYYFILPGADSEMVKELLG